MGEWFNVTHEALLHAKKCEAKWYSSKYRTQLAFKSLLLVRKYRY